jgi:hypothetical protein
MQHLRFLILPRRTKMPTQAFAQILGYADADNPSEAVKQYTAEVKSLPQS